MNIFNRIIAKQFDAEMRLGNPLSDSAAQNRRLHNFAQMTGGRGFRVPPQGPKVSRGGKTRKERIADGTLRPRLLKVRP